MQTRAFVLTMLLSVVAAENLYEQGRIVADAVPLAITRTENKPRLTRAPTGHNRHDSDSSSSVANNDAYQPKTPGFDVSMDDYEQFIRDQEAKHNNNVVLPADSENTGNEFEESSDEVSFEEPTVPVDDSQAEVSDDSSTQTNSEETQP